MTNYFDNLLPDSSDIRRRLRRRFQTRSDEAFDLLTAIGRDCAGAVQLLPPDDEPKGWDRIDAEPLDRGAGRGDLLASVHVRTRRSGQGDEDELSASRSPARRRRPPFCTSGRKWHRPHGATPTTHILKLPLGLVGNMRRRHAATRSKTSGCAARILARWTIESASHGRWQPFGATKALVVTRSIVAGRASTTGPNERLRFQATCRCLDRAAAAGGLLPGARCRAGPQVPVATAARPSGLPPVLATAKRRRRSCDLRAGAASRSGCWQRPTATPRTSRSSTGAAAASACAALRRLVRVADHRRRPQPIPYERARLAMAVRGGKHALPAARHPAPPLATPGRSLRTRCVGAHDRDGGGVDGMLERVEAALPRGFPVRTWKPIAAGVRRHAQQFQRSLI